MRNPYYEPPGETPDYDYSEYEQNDLADLGYYDDGDLFRLSPPMSLGERIARAHNTEPL